MRALLAASLPLLLGPLLAGCFTTLETAKTVDGASMTLGVQRYSLYETRDESHYFLVLMPRFGVAATEDNFGLDFGVRFLTDALDHPRSRQAGWMFQIEPKLQLPENPIADVAVGAEFLLVYPWSFSVFVSRDLGPHVTPFARATFQPALWNLLRGDRADVPGIATRLTLGTAVSPGRNVWLFLEGERYVGGIDDRDVRVAGGVEFHLVSVAKRHRAP